MTGRYSVTILLLKGSKLLKIIHKFYQNHARHIVDVQGVSRGVLRIFKQQKKTPNFARVYSRSNIY